jgi:hypothetical protein
MRPFRDPHDSRIYDLDPGMLQEKECRCCTAGEERVFKSSVVDAVHRTECFLQLRQVLVREPESVNTDA